MTIWMIHILPSAAAFLDTLLVLGCGFVWFGACTSENQFTTEVRVSLRSPTALPHYDLHSPI
ncbi:hypothetical protein EX30DRAFT_29985 [Ascodesmis nigricans]|uniref:Uncharacterized protein n=1 Tax=Ascodesmis nigricans TaxID=341454 RepID=A0A4V3SJX2_9PEZI|nr:hypothetical protein EX30DRAFT_29985 [Ascodesmis nigricans]